MSRETTLPDALLLAAFARTTDCPPPERYLPDEAARLSETERQRNERHADECPTCAMERELAQSFDGAGSEPADVDFVVERLEERAAWNSPAPSRSRFAPWTLAAAAVIVLGVLGVLRPTGPEAPALPSFGGSEVTRGTVLDGIEPAGDLAAVPETLRWQPVEDAARYRVRLMRVDDTVIWEETSTKPALDLTEEVAGTLHPRVVYYWRIEALDEAGQRLAVSERTRFRVVPDAEDRPGSSGGEP